MRVLLVLVIASCAAPIAIAEDGLPEVAPRQDTSRPITDLFENLRAEPLSATEPAAHKVVVRFSEDLFTSLVHRDIDEQSPVQEVILGTPVAGQARTLAQPRVNLIPHSSQAALEVVMEGTTVSRTTGRNGPAIIHSRSTTQFRAVKQVHFSPQKGFYALPATIELNTQLVTESIGSTRGGLLGRLVRRRASREVQEKRPQTLAIVQGKAARRIAAVLDEQVNEGLARLNRRKEVRGILLALLPGNSSPQYACCSTEHYVQIAASLGPGADRPIILPAADYLTSPVQVWIHRSVLRPQIPAILSRLGGGPLDMSGLVSFSQAAPVAFLGAELIKTAATNAYKSSPFDVETIADWMVVEFGKQPPSGRVVRR
ncbi:MAG TPA: hypothetical protein VMP01_25215 [Pirellulaceae bacterium]|nr:hypothetical protein [Pirellulaceae bacterium]